MKKEEKQQIYELLKKADTYINGYENSFFSKQIEFTDDKEIETNNFQLKNNELNSITENKNESNSSNSNNSNVNSQKLTIEDLNEKIKKCTRCQLNKNKNNAVTGKGIDSPLVLVIGEGPNLEEDLQGIPFTGKEGILLDKMLGAINLSRNENCYLTNILKCIKHDNKYLSEEIDSCFSFLEAQIHILKPKMILCLGQNSFQKLLDTQESLEKIHGQFFEYNNIPVMVTYHPGVLLKNEAYKRPAWEDLKLFKNKLDEITK